MTLTVQVTCDISVEGHDWAVDLGDEIVPVIDTGKLPAISDTEMIIVHIPEGSQL